jgi:hypothetical protein
MFMNFLFRAGVLLAAYAMPLAMGAQSASPVRSATVAEQYLQSAADQERAALHLPPLRRDPALVEAATLHAEQMVRHNEISHQFSGEADLSSRGAAAGAHFSLISENVAEGFSPVEIHDAWMHSPGHRHNLLDSAVDSVGIAVLVRGHQLFAVEDFARTVRRIPLAQQEAEVATLLEPYGVSLLDDGDARRTCAMSAGYSGSREPLFVMRYSGGDLSRLPESLKTRLASGKYSEAAVGACELSGESNFTGYSIAVLLYR